MRDSVTAIMATWPVRRSGFNCKSLLNEVHQWPHHSLETESRDDANFVVTGTIAQWHKSAVPPMTNIVKQLGY